MPACRQAGILKQTSVFLVYYSEDHRQKWEALASQLRSAIRASNAFPKNYFYTVFRNNAQEIYSSLRLALAECGIPLKEQMKDKKILIIGTGPGMEVRIARDLGINAIGVEPFEKIVDVGYNLGIVTPQELFARLPIDHMNKTQDNSLDAIVGLNQLIGPKYLSDI